MHTTSLQQNQMYKELDEKIIFEKAQEFGKEYLESVFERFCNGLVQRLFCFTGVLFCKVLSQC